MTTLSIQLLQWQAKRRRRFLQLSASQMETFDLCGRKWWNARVYGLDVEESSHGQVVGTVTHSVNERYLLADHLGRDRKTGYPVELYPEGWHLARNRYNPHEIDGEAFPEDQDKIKRLFDEAVAKGIIVRTPDTMIEHEFRLELLSLPCGYCGGSGGTDEGKKCEACGGDGKGDHLQMVGFIDVFNAEGVQDHKTTSKMKYAKSAQDLTENIQMMSYAKVHMQVYPNNPTRKIKLRHNVFCLDPKDLRVRKTEVEVSWAQVEDFWQNKILRLAREMAHWRRAANHWTHIPDPDRKKNACNAYGGCPFQTICGGKETVEMFEARHSLTCSVVSETPALGVEVIPENPGENTMSQFPAAFPTSFAGAPVGAPVHPGAQAHFNQMPGPTPAPQAPGMGFSAGPATTPIVLPGLPMSAPVAAFPQPGSTAAISGPVEPFALPATMNANLPNGQQQPPWAVTGCGACGGFGFNSNGHPCQICDTVQRSLNKPTSSMFVQTVPGNGTLAWVPKQGVVAAAGQAPTQTAQQPIKTEERQAQVQVPIFAAHLTPVISSASVQPEQPLIQQAAASETPAQTEAKTDGKRTKGPKGGVGRPKKGFVLCIARSEAAGVCYGEEEYGSGRGVYTLGQVLANVGPEIAKAAGKANFLDIPVFERRDLITRNSEKIVETFGTDWVVAAGLGEGQSDLRTLLDAIRPFAGMVFIAG